MSDVPSVQDQISQAWQRVPAGERRELATRANLKGAQACLLALIFGVTLAFCFKESTILLALLAFVPVFYQVVATREWLEGKPRIAITYFVAEKAASQYARHYRTADPLVRLLFKATLTSLPTESIDPRISADIPQSSSSVWVALLSNRLIIFSERSDGARIEFSEPLGDGLSVSSDTSDDPNTRPDSLYLEVSRSDTPEVRRWTLRGPCGETLATCERKIRLYGEQIRAEQERRAAEAAEKARLEEERLELARQERLRIEERRRAQELADRQHLIEELSVVASHAPDAAPPAP
jgi:signal transduction histidine kinase